MGIIGGLLTLPLLGAPRLAHWLARTLLEEAEPKPGETGRLQEAFLELESRYQAGEIEEEEYAWQEEALLERIEALRNQETAGTGA